MRDPERIDRMIGKLRALWKDNPDQRLGQLVVNLYRQPVTSPTPYDCLLFNVEDDDMEIEIDDTLKHGWS